MVAREAKVVFRECCEKLGLDCDVLIKLGAGNPNDPNYFTYQSDHTKRSKSQLYAVKYFEKEDVYIAWNLSEPYGKGKNTFRLSKTKIDGLKPGQILTIEKGIEYPGWDTENVFAFRPDAVTRFLKVYVAPRS